VVQSVQRRGQGRGFPLYYKQQAFCVVETTTPLCQLRRWSALHHGNVLMLSAVLGECDNHPGTCYQLTPVVAGDLQHLMERCNLPSLMECLSSLSSDRADLVSWNVKYILREILKGLEYLHSKEVKIVHGDLKLHNILIDIVCNCEDIFQCPHEGESGYRVYISDFDKAAHIGEGGAVEVDDVYSFGALLKSVLGISCVDECTSMERECVGLEGLGDVLMACHELNPEHIPTASDLLKHPFFSLCPPPSALPRAVLPLSSEEEDSPPLAVQAQQQPIEDCKHLLGFKTPETLAHLLTSEHSTSSDLSTPDQPPSADEIQPHQPTSKPTTSSPAVSAASEGKDSDQSCEQLVDGWKPPNKQPCSNSANISKNINCPPGELEPKAAPSCNDTANIEKTEETPAHPLTTKHSQSTVFYNPSESALAVIQRKTSTPTTPSTPSPAANTSEDRNEVRPGDLDDCQKRSMFPNNSTEEREEGMADLLEEVSVRAKNRRNLVLMELETKPDDSTGSVPTEIEVLPAPNKAVKHLDVLVLSVKGAKDKTSVWSSEGFLFVNELLVSYKTHTGPLHQSTLNGELAKLITLLLSAYKRLYSKLTSFVLASKYLEQLSDGCVSVRKPSKSLCSFVLDFTSKRRPITVKRFESRSLHFTKGFSKQCDSKSDLPESALHHNCISIEKSTSFFYLVSENRDSDVAGPPEHSNAVMHTIQKQKAKMYSDAASKETRHPACSQPGCSGPSPVAKSSWMSKDTSVTGESKVTNPTTTLSSKMSSTNGDCAATQSVPDVSTTCKDNDLRNPEATSVSFGALENSAVDIGLVCQGELTIPVPYCGFQYSRINDRGVETYLHDPVPPRHLQCGSAHAKDQGCKVLLSNVPEVFSVGDRVPCPSGVVQSVQRRGQGRGFPLYYKQQAFCVVETTTPLCQLRRWSALHHGNVLMLSAVLGECDNHPGTCYQLTPVVAGEVVVMVTDSTHFDTPIPFHQ
jgi:serine/threonine protein kinase